MTVVHETRIGPLYLEASTDGLTLLGFTDPDEPGPPIGVLGCSVGKEHLDLARREIDAYLDGTLRAFTVPVDLTGAHDRRILDGLGDVGWGATITYGALARKVGLPVSDARRVGGAMARNPVAIVVPCHRVVGADGALTGYAGGLETKRALLDLEAVDTMLF